VSDPSRLLTPATEIRALTGLRGVAALYVVLFHAQTLCPVPEVLRPFVAHGYMAVDLFFVLSGFVMALTCAGMFAQDIRLENVRRFLGLRVARTYPLFALMTLLTALASMRLMPLDRLLHDLFFNLLLIHSWGFADPLVAPGWSISAEWAAYLLFPLTVYWAMHTSRVTSLVVAALAFAVLVVLACGPSWLAGQPIATRGGPLDISSAFAPGTLLRCLCEFQIGMACYRFRAIIPAWSAAPLAGAALVLLGVPNADILLVPVFASLIMALSHDSGAVARGLQSRAALWLGAISYALYLVQDIVMRTIAGSHGAWDITLPDAAWALTGIGVSLGLAALCHYGFERRARTRLRALLTTTDRPESPSGLPGCGAANRR